MELHTGMKVNLLEYASKRLRSFFENRYSEIEIERMCCSKVDLNLMAEMQGELRQTDEMIRRIVPIFHKERPPQYTSSRAALAKLEPDAKQPCEETKIKKSDKVVW